MVRVSDAVEKEIGRIFGVDVGDELIGKIRASDFNLGENPGFLDADRIVMAILLRADGNKKTFEDLIKLSESDWRDTLLIAGLEYPNWPAVLKANGYWFPVE